MKGAYGGKHQEQNANRISVSHNEKMGLQDFLAGKTHPPTCSASYMYEIVDTEMSCIMRKPAFCICEKSRRSAAQ